MQTTIPSARTVLGALLRADFTAQWRNRRSVMLVVLVPLVILFSWKDLVPQVGGAFVLANCITIGLNAIGLMGYSNSVARDRDKGIFQRLRVAPAPGWCIMASRLLVQLSMIVLVTVAVFIVGFYADHISVSPAGYILSMCTAIVGGALYLGLGQAIVGLVKNPETVNAVSRLVYFIFIMVGMFGELAIKMGKVSEGLGRAIRWSPYGVVKNIVSTGLQPENWSLLTTEYLLLTFAYAIVFAGVGIRKFKWNTK